MASFGAGKPPDRAIPFLGYLKALIRVTRPFLQHGKKRRPGTTPCLMQLRVVTKPILQNGKGIRTSGVPSGVLPAATRNLHLRDPCTSHRRPPCFPGRRASEGVEGTTGGTTTGGTGLWFAG